MRSDLSRRWRDGYADPPTGIDLCITDACNLSCDYCPLWGSQGLKPTPRFMDLDQGTGVLEEVASFRPSIRIICGESLLHPDWHRFVARARRLGMWSSLITNGILLAENADTMVQSGLLSVGVSLDGPATVNDRARGRGTYARVREGLRALDRAKQRAGSDLPWIEIYTTIHEDNHRHLLRFAEDLASWGLRKLRLQHLIWCSTLQLRQAETTLLALDPGWAFSGDDQCYVRASCPEVDPDLLMAQVRELKGRKWPFEVELVPDLHVEDLAGYYTDACYQRRDRGSCPTLDTYTYVEPNGTLRPCIHLAMGNVFQTPFLEVWNERPYRRFRSHVRRHGRLPTCQRCPC